MLSGERSIQSSQRVMLSGKRSIQANYTESCSEQMLRSPLSMTHAQR